MLKRTAFCFGLMLPGALSAQMLALPFAERDALELALGLTETEYDSDDTNGFEGKIERKILAAGYSNKISNKTSVFGVFGFSFDAETKGDRFYRAEGKGFQFGGGLRFLFWKKDQIEASGYGMLSYVSETYEFDSGGEDLDYKSMAFHLGGVGNFRFNNSGFCYGAVEIIPYDDGELDAYNSEYDEQRDDILNLKLGAGYRVDPKILVRFEFNIAGDKSLVFAGALQL